MWWGIRHEARWGWTQIRYGRIGFLGNVLAYRLLVVVPWIPSRNRVFSLELRDGTVVHYRRNRGDIQGIREIIIDEIYRLPDGVAPTTLVDLGANIGLATVWLARHYAITIAVAVEPVAANVVLLEKNVADNHLDVRVVAKAVGVASGTTTFETSSSSNLGRVGDGTMFVDVVGIGELLHDLGFEPSLLKIDVEGMEGALLQDIDPEWITQFSEIIAELHTEYCDVARLIEIVPRPRIYLLPA